MVLWFAGLSIVAVWAVFRSPALDYRFVIAGALVPVLAVFAGGPPVLHSFTFAVVLLAAVMLATRHRRLARRRAIGLPIGVLLHLVADGSWMGRDELWWPFFGWSTADAVPEAGRNAAAIAAMELVGLLCLGWFYRRFGMSDSRRRERFLRTGQLDRSLAGGARS